MWNFILCSAPELISGITCPQEEEAAGICDDSGTVKEATLGLTYLCANSAVTSDFL